MSIQKELEKEGIEVIGKLDSLITNDIIKDISRRIIETFPDFEFTSKELCEKLSKLTMYRAKMQEGMAEANYFYKNTSIYFNEHIEYEDLSEFAIHECIHYLQEKKDAENKLIKMGLCNYINNKPYGLGLNEAAVQYTSSFIIGIEPDYEKYYNITLYTPSPSYYPIECSLLNEITFFTGNDILFKSTLFSTDDFKNLIIEKTSEKVYKKIELNFDKILSSEEKIIKLNNKIALLNDGNEKIYKLQDKIEKIKNKIANTYINTQNTIIKEFFDNEFSNITNLEQLESFRHKLYKFKDIIGTIENYNFYDNYLKIMMNKLEHKCNILENGGTETALNIKHKNIFKELIEKIFKFNTSKSKENFLR